MKKMILDAHKISSIRKRVQDTKLMKFDKKLDLKHQSDPKEYARRANRTAAVCVGFCNVDDQASLLFTLRSSKVNTHAAQVSFPGGHIDDKETAEIAALRELKEETGLDAQVLGLWHQVRAVTGTMVTPVVSFIDKPLNSQLVAQAVESPEEVEITFSLTFDQLAHPETRTMEDLSSRWVMPRFSVPGVEHPVIWGLTAFILDSVLKDVVAPEFPDVFKDYAGEP